MDDGQILAQLKINGEYIKPHPVEYGHLMTLAGIGAGIPDFETEHLVRLGSFNDPDTWTCVSYPGLVDAVAEEIAPVMKELTDFREKNGEAAEPFADIETIEQTPLLGLMMVATMFGSASELEMWADLPS